MIRPHIVTDSASSYGAVKAVELEFLVEHWSRVRDTDGFNDVMSNVAKGMYPYAGTLLTEIFKRASLQASVAAGGKDLPK